MLKATAISPNSMNTCSKILARHASKQIKLIKIGRTRGSNERRILIRDCMHREIVAKRSVEVAKGWRDGDTYTAELIDAVIDAALERGRAARASEPLATAARYDRASGRMIVDLENGRAFAFPSHLAQGLETASDDQLAAVEILGQGFGLHWEELDVDLSLPGLMAGIFGAKSWMARRAGQATSAAKAAAARENGAKGGRPRKSANR